MMIFIYIGIASLVGALGLYLKYKDSSSDGDMGSGILLWLLAAGGVISFVLAGIVAALF